MLNGKFSPRYQQPVRLRLVKDFGRLLQLSERLDFNQMNRREFTNEEVLKSSKIFPWSLIERWYGDRATYWSPWQRATGVAREWRRGGCWGWVWRHQGRSSWRGGEEIEEMRSLKALCRLAPGLESNLRLIRRRKTEEKRGMDAEGAELNFDFDAFQEDGPKLSWIKLIFDVVFFWSVWNWLCACVLFLSVCLVV